MMIWTVGHGSRTMEELLGLLAEAEVTCLVDVRAYPASRRHPQFNRDGLERSLAAAGLRYIWQGEALGGRRRPAPDSLHTALRNAGFRAYADHMLGGGFQRALEDLIRLAARERPAILCAERLPWRCHRFLIADALSARDIPVMHLVSPGKPHPHALSAAARVERGRLIYDAGVQQDLAL